MFYFKGEERTKGEGMKRMEGDCLIFEDTMLIRTVLASLLLYLCSLTFLPFRSLVPSCSFPRSWPFHTSTCKDCSGTCQVSFFFPLIFISWRLITLQHCSGFCHISDSSRAPYTHLLCFSSSLPSFLAFSDFYHILYPLQLYDFAFFVFLVWLPNS